MTLDGTTADGDVEDEEDEGGLTMILDPSLEEEKIAKSRFVFAWAFGAGLGQKGSGSENVYLESEGAFDNVQVSDFLMETLVRPFLTAAGHT